MVFTIERFGSLAAVLNNLPPPEIYNMSIRDKIASSTHNKSILIESCYEVDTEVSWYLPNATYSSLYRKKMRNSLVSTLPSDLHIICFSIN